MALPAPFPEPAETFIRAVASNNGADWLALIFNPEDVTVSDFNDITVECDNGTVAASAADPPDDQSFAVQFGEAIGHPLSVTIGAANAAEFGDASLSKPASALTYGVVINSAGLAGANLVVVVEFKDIQTGDVVFLTSDLTNLSDWTTNTGGPNPLSKTLNAGVLELTFGADQTGAVIVCSNGTGIIGTGTKIWLPPYDVAPT